VTTVAYKNGELAGDNLISCGSYRHSTFNKVLYIKGYHVGMCGELQDMHAFVKYVSEDFKETPNLNEGFEAILVRDGVVSMCDYKGLIYPVTLIDDCVAIGSGTPFALGAMAAGKDAKDAVAIAAKFDSGTGKEITVVNTRK
jgi:20S proteasome alpha/beta subunit